MLPSFLIAGRRREVSGFPKTKRRDLFGTAHNTRRDRGSGRLVRARLPLLSRFVRDERDVACGRKLPTLLPSLQGTSEEEVGERPAVKSGLIDILFAAAMDEGSAEKKVELFPPAVLVCFMSILALLLGSPRRERGVNGESKRVNVELSTPCCHPVS